MLRQRARRRRSRNAQEDLDTAIEELSVSQEGFRKLLKPKNLDVFKLVRCSLMIMPETDAALKRLGRDASDYIGWTVSSSAIVRALVRYTELQLPRWARPQLFPLVEREIASGTVGGGRESPQGRRDASRV
jgi:hypothetical protein